MEVTVNPSYLAIDPGDTTGWAHFNELGDLMAFGQVKEAEYNRWLAQELENKDLKAIICENYLNATYNVSIHVSRRNRSNKTSKKIGAIEALAEIHGVPVILQPNTDKTIGYMWSGFEKPTNHDISHQFDAVAHGVYYLVKNEIRSVAKTLRNMT